MCDRLADFRVTGFISSLFGENSLVAGQPGAYPHTSCQYHHIDGWANLVSMRPSLHIRWSHQGILTEVHDQKHGCTGEAISSRNLV